MLDADMFGLSKLEAALQERTEQGGQIAWLRGQVWLLKQRSTYVQRGQYSSPYGHSNSILTRFPGHRTSTCRCNRETHAQKITLGSE